MWVDIQQNSEEWYKLREGKVTSSNFDTVMANSFNSKKEFKPSLAFGRPAIQYGQQLALERVTKKRKPHSYKSSDMSLGHVFEPVAITAYEREYFCEVTNGGFNYQGKLGDSPDGNLNSVNGCVEVKSVIANTQWVRLKKGGYDTAYKWQIQGHLWLGERDFCDFISYCHSEEFLDSKRLYVFRVERDEIMIRQLQERLVYFENTIEGNIQLLTKN